MSSIDNNQTILDGDAAATIALAQIKQQGKQSQTNRQKTNNKNTKSINNNNNHKDNYDDSYQASQSNSNSLESNHDFVVPVDQVNNHQINQQKPSEFQNNTNTTTTTTNGTDMTNISMPNNDNITTLNLPLLGNTVGDNNQTTMNNNTTNGTNGTNQQPFNAYSQQQIVDTARKAFASNKTKDVKFRKKQLRQLQLMVTENKEAICDALRADLNKPIFETNLGETNLFENELREFLGTVDEFAKPQSKSKTFLSFFDSVYVQQEPLGVCLVIGAWNYPFLLSLAPFAGAIAAGNCVILKVSEHAPFVGSLIESLIPRYLDNECYHVFNTDLNATSHLLKSHRFDHIFYTGGENGGRAIYSEASKHLTPVVLELGGKSPVYIDDNVIDKEAVWMRLYWGKFLNAGQTCVAPDYVMCSEKAQDSARKHFLKMMDKFYQGDALNSKDYSRIINVQNFERLKRLVKESRLVLGGQLHPDKLQIEPAIITDVSLDNPIMKEEIFGPLLPFVTVNSVQQAINIINEREKPLALYVFSNSNKTIDKFARETSSGGLVVNDVILHINSISLPFGGVGGSGFGKYHGKYSLETFSNSKAVVKRSYNPILESIGSARYPPYNDKKLFVLTQLGMTRNIWYPGPVLQGVLLFVSGAASVIAYNIIATLI